MQKSSFNLFDPFIYALQTFFTKFYITIPFLALYFVVTTIICQVFINFFNFFCLRPFTSSFLLDALIVLALLFIISSICLLYIYTSLKWYDSKICTFRQLCSHFNKIPTSLFLFILVPLVIVFSLYLTFLIIASKFLTLVNTTSSRPFIIIFLLLIITLGVHIALFLYFMDRIILSTHYGIDKQHTAKEAWQKSRKFLDSYKWNIIASCIVIDFILLVSFFIFKTLWPTNERTLLVYIPALQLTCLFVALHFTIQTLATTYIYRSLIPVLPENVESIHAEVPL